MTEEIKEMEDALPAATPGRFLREKRVQADLSQQDIADSLNLKLNIIQAIEDNDFELIGQAIFVKGYLRSIAKLLELDEAYIISLYEDMGVNESKNDMRSFSRRTIKESHDNKLMLVTYFIALVLIASGIIYWWQQPVKSGEPLLPVPESLVGLSDALKEATSLADDDENLEQVTQVVESAVSNDLAEPSDAALTVQSSTVKDAADVIALKKSQLVMEFSQSSWLEVYDAEDKQLINEQIEAGKQLKLEGSAPFSLVVGAPEFLIMSLDGEDVSLAQYPASKTARFSLPNKSE